MVDWVGELSSNVALLEDEARVLEHAIRAMWDVCRRGIGMGMTHRGEDAHAVGAFRVFDGERWITQPPPHLALVRTPAYDVRDVPVGQRNRWVEPFREGIATHEGFRSSTLYPFVSRFGVLEQGRVAVCAGARQIALVGVAIPEGSDFTEDEREQLQDLAERIVVPVRIASVLARANAPSSSHLAFVERAKEAVVLRHRGRPGIVQSLARADAILRADRDLARWLDAAPLPAPGDRARWCNFGFTVHVSPWPDDVDVYVLAIDEGTWIMPSVELTTRQREILEHVALGRSNAEIALALGIAEGTVKTVLERLYRRTGTANRVELTRWFREG